MQRPLKGNFEDRTNPMDKHFTDMVQRRGFERPPRPPPSCSATPAGEYMERYGVTAETFARIGEKNHRHSVNKPVLAVPRPVQPQDILGAPTVYDPLTKLQCCPHLRRRAAAVVASERFVKEHARDRAVEIAGQA